MRNAAYVIKVCGVTTVEDVRVAVEAGATAIGFNFYPLSPRFLTISKARNLAEAVPPGVDRVGVFVAPDSELLAETVDRVPLDVAQLHGEMPAFFPRGVRVWRTVAVDEDFAGVPADPRIEAYVLDAPSDTHGGSGRTFDWTRVAEVKHQRIVLAGGLEAANVGEAIRTVAGLGGRLWGVDACSWLEAMPGRKDAEKVKAFVEAARRGFEG